LLDDVDVDEGDDATLAPLLDGGGEDATLAPLLDGGGDGEGDVCAFIWLEKYIFTTASDKINTIIVHNDVFFIFSYLPPGVHFDL
jgi:hypothetical protein